MEKCDSDLYINPYLTFHKGIPYFAYLISMMADLINVAIMWAKTRHNMSAQITAAIYIIGGTILMIAIPARIFILVEGKSRWSIFGYKLLYV